MRNDEEAVKEKPCVSGEVLYPHFAMLVVVSFVVVENEQEALYK
jgi:hypothetical protein